MQSRTPSPSVSVSGILRTRHQYNARNVSMKHDTTQGLCSLIKQMCDRLCMCMPWCMHVKQSQECYGEAEIRYLDPLIVHEFGSGSI